MIALAHQALQLRTISPPYIPTIRTSFGFGSRIGVNCKPLLGVAPEVFVSEEGLAIDANSATSTEVDSLMSHYAIIKTRNRAVFLLDIAGFSLFSPEEQAAQLTTLDYSLNIARETGATFGIELDLARSTTGDGFYVWNRNKGQEAELASIASPSSETNSSGATPST